MRLKLPFLITGFLYVLLAIATMFHGLTLLRPAIDYARAHHLPGLEKTPQNVETVKFFILSAFYALMAALVLLKTYLTFALIGAIFSLFLIPLGTIPGLLFLFWTRKAWAKETPIPPSNHLAGA